MKILAFLVVLVVVIGTLPRKRIRKIRSRVNEENSV